MASDVGPQDAGTSPIIATSGMSASAPGGLEAGTRPGDGPLASPALDAGINGSGSGPQDADTDPAGGSLEGGSRTGNEPMPTLTLDAGIDAPGPDAHIADGGSCPQTPTARPISTAIARELSACFAPEALIYVDFQVDPADGRIVTIEVSGAATPAEQDCAVAVLLEGARFEPFCPPWPGLTVIRYPYLFGRPSSDEDAGFASSDDAGGPSLRGE